MADTAPTDPDRFVGSSEDEEATILVWPNAGDEISIWLEEDYRKEGQPDLYSASTLCSLPKPVAAALGRRLLSLALPRQDAAAARHAVRVQRGAAISWFLLGLGVGSVLGVVVTLWLVGAF